LHIRCFDPYHCDALKRKDSSAEKYGQLRNGHEGLPLVHAGQAVENVDENDDDGREKQTVAQQRER